MRRHQRVLFVTWAWPSHFFPMVPLAWALQAAGHEVRVASGPSLAGPITQAGLTAVPIGRPDDNLARASTRGELASWHSQPRWPADWPVHPDKLDADQLALTRNIALKQVGVALAMAPELICFARRWEPDLVVYDQVSLAGPLAAAAAGVPALGHLWGCPAVIRQDRLMATGEPLAEFVEMFTRFGLQPRLNPRAWIDPCPPSLLLPTDLPRLALRYVPYNGPAVMADWLLDWPDRPRVCVTRGVTGPRIHGGAPDLFYRMVEALTGLDIEVVLAVGAGQAGQLGDIPAGVRVVEGVAFNLLLPSCAVVVHQGGGGTTMTALVCGTPQLILSPRPEQMVTGDQIAASRAGEHLVYNELPDDPDSVEAIRSAVADLVGDPARPAAALRLQHEALKMPAPAELVPALLDLAGRG